METQQTSLIKKRIDWIDNAKLIGIFFVLIAHTGKMSGNCLTFLNSFTMPFFFFLSGMMQKETPLKKTIQTGFKTLMIPYFAFYLITLPLNLSFMAIEHPSLVFSKQFLPLLGKLIVGMFYGIGHDTKISYMHNVPLWYLPSLFSARVIFSLINAASKKYRHVCQAVFAVIFAVVAVIFHPGMAFVVPFGIGPAFMCYPFFIFGFFLFNKFPELKNFLENKEKSRIIIKLGLFVLSIALVMLLNRLNGLVEVNGMGYGNNPILFYANALPGIAMVILVSSLVKFPKKADVFSQNTLIIFAFGNSITFAILYVLKHLSKVFYEVSFVIGFFVALATLLLCYIPIKIIWRYFPWMLGKKKQVASENKTSDKTSAN